MGTSASTSGPNNRSPLIPSWAEESDPNDQLVEYVNNELVQQQIGITAKAPLEPNRFNAARREFGKYAHSSGTRSNLKRALKYYAQKGSGGGKNTSRRLASGITAGFGLFGLLRGETVSNKTQTLSFRELQGLSDDQVIDRIASHLAPNNADADQVRIALDYALAEALPKQESFDIANITDEIMQELIGCYLTDLIFQDVVEGMGKAWFNAEHASKQHQMEFDLRELIKVITQMKLGDLLKTQSRTITKENIVELQSKTITAVVDEWESYND